MGILTKSFWQLSSQMGCAQYLILFKSDILMNIKIMISVDYGLHRRCAQLKICDKIESLLKENLGYSCMLKSC
jgi:hypothetical protein